MYRLPEEKQCLREAWPLKLSFEIQQLDEINNVVTLFKRDSKYTEVVKKPRIKFTASNISTEIKNSLQSEMET